MPHVIPGKFDHGKAGLQITGFADTAELADDAETVFPQIAIPALLVLPAKIGVMNAVHLTDFPQQHQLWNFEQSQ